VSELLPAADDAQRFTVYLEVKADAEMLKPLSTGEVTITVAQRPDQMMILRRAVFDANKVFLVKNGRVERRELEIGFVALNVVEVRKGLEVGDLVIVDRIDEFREGQRVRVEIIK
jgi:multidrug efflux pump subunit AcrA (membrane-fusion protein)